MNSVRTRVPHRSRLIVTALVVFASCVSGAMPRLPAQQDERSVRTAYLFNLTRYVDWPSAHNQIVIGVAGTGEIGPEIKSQLENKLSNGRRVTIFVHPGDAELRSCDILYIPASAETEFPALLSRTAGRPVLTVGETQHFTRHGGMVGLVRSGDQIQIQVNLDALRASRLTMSSRLLNLAVLTHTTEVRQ